MRYVYEFRLQFFELKDDGSLRSLYGVNDRGKFYSKKERAIQRFNRSCERSVSENSAVETDLFDEVFAKVPDLIAAKAFICGGGILVACRFVQRHYLQ